MTLVYSDLCGLMDMVSFGKAQYFCTFIDDYSRKSWVYFLQENSQVFSHFLEFKALVEKQSGLKILTLEIDNGGDYKSNEFFEIL
jgi:transposase InsO family protein